MLYQMLRPFFMEVTVQLLNGKCIFWPIYLLFIGGELDRRGFNHRQTMILAKLRWTRYLSRDHDLYFSLFSNP